MWNKIKRILVWTQQVRPIALYSYSYDFRNKSTSTLTSDGWNIFTNSSHMIFNSDWFTTDNAQYAVMAKIENSDITTALQTSTKVTLSFTAKIINTFGWRMSLYNTATSSTRSWVTWPQASNGGSQIQTTIYWTNITDSRTINSTMTVTTVLDFTAKTWNTTATDGYTRSGTLTDTQISNIKNNSNWFYVTSSRFDNSNTNWRMTSMYVRIE